MTRLQRIGFEVRAELEVGDEQPWVQLTRGQAEALGLTEGAHGVACAAAGRSQRPGGLRAFCRNFWENARCADLGQADYAVRALLSLAAHEPDLVKVDVIVARAGAAAQVRRGDPRRTAPGRRWCAASAAPRAGTRWPGRRARSRSAR